MDSESSLKHFHRVIFTLGVVTLGIYGAAIIAAMLFFRAQIAHQVLHRDGSLLTRVTQHFHDTQATVSMEPDWLEIALESSEISGVIGVRLYNVNGELMGSIPASLYPASLTNDDLVQLQDGHPVFRHFSDLSLESLFSDVETEADRAGYPISEILAPVQSGNSGTAAVIQYWLDGTEVAAELKRLDQFLITLGTVFFLAGGIIFAIVLVYARGRLLRMGTVLAERNKALEQANTDLALAARTSAIGSVTSHLFHGLKNPLAGLKAYLRLTGQDEEVMAIADRMQSLIDEALNVISEENSLGVDLTIDEFKELAESRLTVRDNGRVVVDTSGEGNVGARKAQLLLLILRNLVENAVQASSPRSPVQVRLRISNTDLLAQVEDNGPGIPKQIRDHLFEPVHSSKTNGTGIGLAISSVIARHIPASLKLVRSDQGGTLFNIQMPL